MSVTYDPSQGRTNAVGGVLHGRARSHPTQPPGPDEGTQYRSIVFYGDTVQRRIAQAYVAELTRKQVFKRPVVTEIVPLTTFYEAEAYHQNYMARHPRAPYIVYNDAPKVANLQRQFPALYREPLPE